MTVGKDSPKNRRKSIAVPNQNKSSVLPRAKRRPHSIVPGDRLSPFAKAHRSLVPRKSILKTFTNILHDGDDTPGSFQMSSADDPNGTQSMDVSRDFHSAIQNNTIRKSLGGRRVSFANRIEVRLIKGKSNDEKESPQPTPESNAELPERSQQAPTDENAYPGAASVSHRRSSARYSLAYSEDMDLTTIAPSTFLPVDGSAIVDEDFDYYDDSGMEMTEVIRGDLVRKRSLSTGIPRPLSQVPQSIDRAQLQSDPHEQSQSSEGDELQLQSDIESDQSQVMDFTMPLDKSLRLPAQHDEAWLALRQATHSGDTPIESVPSSDDFGVTGAAQGEDGMDLGDAVQRLMRARESLPSVQPIRGVEGNSFTYGEQEPQNETFSSTDESFEDNGDQTMNMTKVFGRASLAGAHPAHMSSGYQESTMDQSEIYGVIVAPIQSTPTKQAEAVPAPSAAPIIFKSPLPNSSADRPTVFSVPTSHQPAVPTIPLSFTLKTIVSATEPKAPGPVPSSPPKISANAKPRWSTSFNRTTDKPALSLTSSPNKRRRSSSEVGREYGESVRLSPVKRVVVAGKRPTTITSSKGATFTTSSHGRKPLSPSKKAPFQAPTASALGPRPSSSLRRPSGYFARRKSWGVGLGPNGPREETPATGSSAEENVTLGLKRTNIDSDSPGARILFDRDVSKGVEEAVHQAAASPTPNRGSTASTSPRPNSQAPISTNKPSSSPAVPVIDISSLLGPGRYEVDESEVNMERWRNAVEPIEFEENDEPPISIQQFFSLTGIKFMDELTAPRRSIHPSQQDARQARNHEEIPLAEYVSAIGIDIPQLVLYSRVSKDLRAWIEKSKEDFVQAEDEASKITPELFTEYSRADEEGQAELLHQLQLIRTNTRALAKSDWYDWKLQWLEGLRVTAEKTFKSLEEDAIVLDVIRQTADEVIPSLKYEYDELMREFEKEQTEVAEIEASDQGYLNDLKASIAEQNIEVEALKAEVAEGKAQLLWLQERQAEMISQKQEAINAITDAQRLLHIQKKSTRAEVFRLKDELENLEDLHMFCVTKVEANLFEYVYASKFRVSLPCRNFTPIAKQAKVSRVEKTRNRIKDNFPRLSDFLLYMAQEQIVRTENQTIRQIVQRFSDYWSSCSQLRSQLKLITTKYPVEVEILQRSFKTKVMVLFPSVKAKAFVSFVFDVETFSYWPITIHSLYCEVEVAYGNIDHETILSAVRDRLREATPADNYACLLDACIEAQEIYH